tara:strand:- start:3052 stop:3252 length:201 start_codon:yes stop_codon:yes gene_type:complete
LIGWISIVFFLLVRIENLITGTLSTFAFYSICLSYDTPLIHEGTSRQQKADAAMLYSIMEVYYAMA